MMLNHMTSYYTKPSTKSIKMDEIKIIYKAKSLEGVWVTGYYYSLEKNTIAYHYIINPKTPEETFTIDNKTICIGCIIDNKEFFAGDKVEKEGKFCGIITFSLTRGFAIYNDGVLWSLVSNSHLITVSGSIHADK